MGLPANYEIVEDPSEPSFPLVLRDVGPWDKHFTITNDAEGVIARLVAAGAIGPARGRPRTVLYYDSEGELTELRYDWTTGRFLGFGPGSPRLWNPSGATAPSGW